MTREESLDAIEIDYDTEGYAVPIESMTSFTDVVNLVSKIYDDFESRTCESCKHNKFKKTTVKDDGFFECDLLYMESSSWWTTDFGCNKWAFKDDKNKQRRR